MVNSKKDDREAKARRARMQANQELHQTQITRRKRDNVIAAGAIVVAVGVACVLALTVFTGPKNDVAGDIPSESPSTSASPTAVETNSPTVPNADTAAGKTFTGTLTLNGQQLGVSLDGTTAAQASAVFKSLADENFFAGKDCHRLADSENFGVLQCGSLNGDGNGDPSYQWGPVENSPADGKYPAGTIAVARGQSTYSNGTQFFITFKDTILPQDTGGYTIVGKLTSGLDVVTAIADAGIVPGANSATDGAPKTPVTIDSFTLN
ncbi:MULTISPECIES: peptidylprolyl isomerase [Arthrobacter]|uniref:peptidylprolyl isomerase n=1 Tax=Arthrobacter TaxID=1663 RepID=UPI0037C16855